jgi:hypothetical protein
MYVCVTFRDYLWGTVFLNKPQLTILNDINMVMLYLFLLFYLVSLAINYFNFGH